jgi:hypothetical protein
MSSGILSASTKNARHSFNHHSMVTTVNDYYSSSAFTDLVLWLALRQN